MTTTNTTQEEQLRFIQRVLESSAPEQDRKDARDMVVAMRKACRTPPAEQPIEEARIVGYGKDNRAIVQSNDGRKFRISNMAEQPADHIGDANKMVADPSCALNGCKLDSNGLHLELCRTPNKPAPAHEQPPVFDRRFQLARDGFGLVRDDEDGNYVHIGDAVSVISAYATQATAALQMRVSCYETLNNDQAGTITELQAELTQLREQAERDARDAETFRYLRDHHSYHYLMGSDSPAECGISFHWQQATPEESNLGLEDVLRAAIAKQKEQG